MVVTVVEVEAEVVQVEDSGQRNWQGRVVIGLTVTGLGLP